VLADKPRALLRQAVAQGVNAPLSSSAGRLFDAAACALGLAPARQSFEGEAAMALEALARQAEGDLPVIPLPEKGGALDTTALMMGLMETGQPVAERAAQFHHSLAEGFARRARALVARGEAKAVALSGGCFQNALLLRQTLDTLADLPVLVHSKLPANDGGLALGQCLIAAAHDLDTR